MEYKGHDPVSPADVDPIIEKFRRKRQLREEDENS